MGNHMWTVDTGTCSWIWEYSSLERKMSSVEFCRDSFWNNSVWNTSVPALSQCFEETVLLGVPCVFLWVATPFWIYFLHQAGRRQTYPPPKRRVISMVFKLLSLMILMTSTCFKLV